MFSGEASVSAYESLLLSLTYTHTDSEPTPGNRSIQLTLSDGLQRDMTAIIVIVVLQNDNPLSLRADSLRLTYSEGDAATPVGILSGVALMDEDRDAMVERLVLTLNGSLERGLGEALVVDTSAVMPGGSGGLVRDTRIEITQTSSLQNYQVSR